MTVYALERHPIVPPSPSAVARRVAIRLSDYLEELDGSFASLWPLLARLPEASGALALEQRRVRICLDWGTRIVTPATSMYLTAALAHASQYTLMAAGRAVSRELRMAAHVAGLDSAQARELATRYVWNAVFAAFTHGHTRPLVPAVQPLLISGHELLERLIEVTEADLRSDAPDPTRPWTSIAGSFPAAVSQERADAAHV